MKVPSDDRRFESSLRLKPESFKKQEAPKTLGAAMEPTKNTNVLINTLENGTQVHLESLKGIWQQLNHTSQSLQGWITEASNSQQGKQLFLPEFHTTPASQLHSPVRKTQGRSAMEVDHNCHTSTQGSQHEPSCREEKLELQAGDLEVTATKLQSSEPSQIKPAPTTKHIAPLTDQSTTAATESSRQNNHTVGFSAAQCNKLDEESNRKSPLYTTTLTRNLQMAETAPQPAYNQIRTTGENLHNQQTADSEQFGKGNLSLQAQLDPQTHHTMVLQRNEQITTENDDLKQKAASLQKQLAAALERSNLIDEDNKRKAILYVAALQRIHHFEEDNQLLKTKIDTAEERHRKATTTDNRDLRKQIKTLQTQHAAEREQNQREQKELRKQLENSKTLQEAALHRNNQNSAENDDLQKQQATAVREAQQILALTQAEKQALREELEILRTQHTLSQKLAEENRVIANRLREEMALLQAQHEGILERNTQLAASLQRSTQQLEDCKQINRRHQGKFAAITEHRIRQVSAQLRSTISKIRDQTSEQIRAFQEEIHTYKTQFHTLDAREHTDPQRIMELTQIEAFNLWINKQPATEEQISAQTLLYKVTTKIYHTLRTLKSELQQATTERDDLQGRLEQQEEEASAHFTWEKFLDLNKMEEPGNMIAATMKNLPPPISIYQYYQAFRPMILKANNMPDLKTQTHLSKEEFQQLWAKANSTARDVLIFMWILKDLVLPKGLAEVTSTNPNFYLTRFCISALTHIQKHHEEFYTNIENRNSLPQIEPYDLDLVKEIQDMADSTFPDFLSALDTLAGEDTLLLHQASHLHQELVRKYPDSFPQSFHRIQLNGYITRALEDRKRTLEQRIISTPHARTLLYLPQYDPGSMKIPKRS